MYKCIFKYVYIYIYICTYTYIHISIYLSIYLSICCGRWIEKLIEIEDSRRGAKASFDELTRATTKSVVVLIIGNSKSNHLGAQATFHPICCGRWVEKLIEMEGLTPISIYASRSICLYIHLSTYVYT